MTEVRISVAMATYNGEKYIRQQLDSILDNLAVDDEVVISDDGSKDGTLEILKEYREKDSRIRLLKGPEEGIIANFEHAMRNCRGEYIFLADQDDVWMADKIESVMECFSQRDVALVIHDARVMEEKLQDEIMPSFFQYRNSGPGFCKNFIKNTYMGCCMAFHKKVRDYVLPIPRDIQMHDQWIGMLSDRKFGKSVFLREKLLLYRRHENTSSDFSRNTVPVMIKNRFVLFRRIMRK